MYDSTKTVIVEKLLDIPEKQSDDAKNGEKNLKLQNTGLRPKTGVSR
jgi:hypothetical protein